MIYLEEIENKALANNVPIMQREGLEFMIETCKKNDVKSVLEIGAAVGYSAAMLALNLEAKVETIELDQDRYDEACANIAALGLEDKIVIHHANALELPNEDLVLQEYDCLFIDAAKAQYQKFFEKYMVFVKPGGICIVDNLDFHGMIFDIENIKNRNTRALVRKIKRFKDWIFNNELYDVEYYHLGDGVCVIRRK